MKKTKTNTLKIRSSKKNSFFSELKNNKIMFFMLVPALIFFIINNYMPMVGIYYAFTRFNFKGGLFGSPFIGMDNFKFLAASGKLWDLTVNTLAYNVAFIIAEHVFAILFAIILSRLSSKIFTRTTQSMMFLPYFVSYVILNVIVYNLFHYDVGFINNILTSLGKAPYDAYNDPASWRIYMVVFYLWKQLGYGTVIYLATITGISPELYEASEIDGANVFQQIRFITFPLIVPTFIMQLLFSLGRIMRGQFDLFYQVIGNNGVLYDVTDILDTFVYRTLRQDFDIGMGTAAGLYQSLFGFIIIMTVNYIIRKKQPEYALF